MRRLSLVFVLMLFVTSFAQAQKRYDELNYPELDQFNRPDIETFTLDNGIRFFLVEDKELPLINVNVIVRTGDVLVPNDKEGLASITGTVIRSGGSENYPADSLNTLLEDKAASMETSIGFSSGGASMNVLKEDFDELLPVFIDLLTHPAFPEDKIDLAKTQAKSAISRRNDDPQQIGNREFNRLIYGKNSVYGRNTEYETLNNIQREDLVNFHKNHFVGKNMMVGLVGDFKTKEMKRKLQKAFASIPAGSATDLDFPAVDYTYKNSINFIDKPDVNQSFVLLGHIGGMRDNPDYAKIQVMNQVLSGGFSGRLFQVVRSDMGLAYAVFGQYEMNSFYPGTFYAGVMTKGSTTAQAIDAIIDQIKRLQNEPITKKELQDTKDQFLNSLVFRYDSYAKILSHRMSNEYRGLSEDAFDKYVQGVRETTIEDVQRVAQEYLDPEDLEILVVGNGDEIGDQLQKYGTVNEIDISIPQPGDNEEQAMAGDAAAGREWFNKMADAVLPGGPIEGDLVFKSDNNVQTPQGEMQLDIEQTVNFDTKKIVSVISTPMGEMTLQLEDGKGTMNIGGNEMPMQPAQKDQMMAEYYRNHLYMAMNKDDFDVEYMGMEEMDGQNLAHIRVKGDETIDLYLDPETSFPMIRTNRQFDPQMGEQVNVKVVSSDWRETDGIVIPYKSVIYANDEVTAESTVTSVSKE